MLSIDTPSLRAVINAELERVYDSLLVAKVPGTWGFCYPSLKGLGSWINDLRARLDQMRKWANEKMPNAFWLTGFSGAGTGRRTFPPEDREGVVVAPKAGRRGWGCCLL